MLSTPAYPERIILDLNNTCNLNCFMCIRHSQEDSLDLEEANNIQMSPEVFEKIIPIINNARAIELGGHGEPLLNFDILEKIDYLKSLSNDAKLTIFTNGLLLYKLPLKSLLKNLDVLHISINGIESYESVMTGANFTRLKDNLQQTKDYRLENGFDFRMELGFIIMKRNFEDLAKSVDFAKEFLFDAITFKSLWSFFPHLDAEQVSNNPELLATLPDMIEKVKASAQKQGIEVNFEDVMPKNNPELPNPTCTDPWKTVQITASGNVLLCCNRKTLVGNLNESSFTDIWNGSEANNYRQGLASGNPYKECNNCKIIHPQDQKSYKRVD